jgi:dipeptidyl aminopeptidase/acylaminoacyl peptidase
MRLIACLFAAVFAANAALAQQTPKRPMTFADLMAMKRVSDPQISSSGRWVLFSVTDVSLEKNTKTNHLWAVPLDGSAKEKQVTSGSGESNGRFSPDGKWVMYSADDHGKGEIFIAPWDEAEGDVGAGHAVTSMETEADGAIWAPDSKHFVFVSEVYPECESHAPMGAQRNEEEAQCNAQKDAAAAKSPVKALVFTHLLYRHWDHYLGNKRSHIFYGDVDGSAPEDLTRSCCADLLSRRPAGLCDLAGWEGDCVCREQGEGAGGVDEQRYLYAGSGCRAGNGEEGVDGGGQR